MLKEILSVTGKPGLFKLVSKAKNMLVIESLADGKRSPAYSSDKVVSLGDIAIFTETEEVSLAKVLESIKAKENGKTCSIDPKSDNDKLRAYLAEILPDYDRDRVYPSDIRKMLSWYNMLVNANLTDFSIEEKEEETNDKKEEAASVIKETKAAPKVKKAATPQKAQTQKKVNARATTAVKKG